LGRGYRRVKRAGHYVVVFVRQSLIGAHHHHALGHSHGRYRTGSRLIRRRLTVVVVVVVELSMVVVVVVQQFLTGTAAPVIAAKVVEFVLDDVGPVVRVVQVLVTVVLLMVMRVVVWVFACARGRFHGR